MSRPVAATTLAASVVLTVVAAFMLPWAVYGQFDIALTRLPGWYVYLAAACACHLAALVRAARRRPAPPIVTSVLALAALIAAVAVMQQYDNTIAIFGREAVIPLVMPARGIGGPVAVLAIILAWTATAWRGPDRPQASSR
jgi:hypothetical protein